jgi:hypothetical protein
MASEIKITKSTEVTLAEILALTNLSKTFILDRVRDGYFEAVRPGVYKLGAVWLGLLKHQKDLRKAATQTESSVEVQKARAAQIRQKTAIEARELIPMADACAMIDKIVGGTKAEMEGMPALLTRDRALRVEYEKIFHDMMQRLSDRYAAIAKEIDDEEDGAEEDAA